MLNKLGTQKEITNITEYSAMPNTLVCDRFEGFSKQMVKLNHNTDYKYYTKII